MQWIRCSALVIGLASFPVTPVLADDAKDARAIVEKAIKAHGGAESLKKTVYSVSTFQGTFRGAGMELPVVGEISLAGATHLKLDMTIEAGGQKIKIITVLAGDKGWTKFGDATMELGKDAITEAQESQHAGWVASLVPLIDGPGYTYATLGEIKVGETPAVGVKVTSKDRRYVDLYFDKTSGLLVKHECRVKDEMTGQEVLEETFHTDYKSIEGTKQPMKFVTKRDSKPHVEGEVSDIRFTEKRDDTVFAKP